MKGWEEETRGWAVGEKTVKKTTTTVADASPEELSCLEGLLTDVASNVSSAFQSGSQFQDALELHAAYRTPHAQSAGLVATVGSNFTDFQRLKASKAILSFPQKPNNFGAVGKGYRKVLKRKYRTEPKGG